MVITITCPSCSSSFPVDPAKIPEGGVKARCSSCGHVFRVEKPTEPEPVPTSEEPAAAPMTDTPPEPEPPSMPEPAAEAAAAPVQPVAGAAAAEAFEESAPLEAAPAAPAEPEPASPSVQGFTFGKRNPTDKAKRLARVLVSDMIMYNAERHQAALAAGTLLQDFEEEIDKSWKEFVDQVGEELATGEGRQFWRQALNDILAKGQEVF